MAVTQDDAFGYPAVIRFLELQFPYIGIGLLAGLDFRGCHVHARAHAVVPCGRAADAGAGIDAGQARMAEKDNRAIGDDRQPPQQANELPDWVRSTSLPANTSALVSMPICFGFRSPASS